MESSLTPQQINAISLHLRTLPLAQRFEELYRHFSEEEVLVTSSFGTSSAYLLHLISRFRPTQPIHFINTGYLFPETLAYRDALVARLGLQLIEIGPDASSHAYTAADATWKKNPDLCCTINKVVPLDEVKARHKVWISGLLGFQNANRSQRPVLEDTGEILKFYPLIDNSEADVKRYLSFFRLPPHPMESKGYGSVGCTHCTSPGTGRAGRWQGSAKTECGLHLVSR